MTVENEDEAKRLISLACPTDAEGHYFSRELALIRSDESATPEQEIAVLNQFGERLEAIYTKFIQEKP